MSSHNPVFYEAVANYMMDDIDRASSKLREHSTEMSDLVEAGLAEWTDSSEARQVQKECAQRLNDRAGELAVVLNSLKRAFEEIRKAGIDAETLAFAAVDRGVMMTSHDFKVDLEALATVVTKLSELQERSKTYDVADYTPSSGMIADPVVVGGLDSFNTEWDQGLNGMLRVISEAVGRLGKVTEIYADYMATCDEAMTRARDVAAAISIEPLVKGIQYECDT